MDLLDRSIIDEVRDALGDEAYRGYAARMLEEMRAVEPVLAGQLAAGGGAVLAQTAHRAAGSAVSVGACGLHRRLKAIEDVVNAGGGDLAALIAGFSADVDATEAAIGALLNAP